MQVGCPLWVKSIVLTVGQPSPVCPDQRTFSAPAGMSQRCQKRTPADHFPTAKSLNGAYSLPEIKSHNGTTKRCFG